MYGYGKVKPKDRRLTNTERYELAMSRHAGLRMGIIVKDIEDRDLKKQLSRLVTKLSGNIQRLRDVIGDDLKSRCKSCHQEIPSHV